VKNNNHFFSTKI